MANRRTSPGGPPPDPATPPPASNRTHAPALMTYAEAMAATTLSASSLQRLARPDPETGAPPRIERVQVGGRYRLTRASVERFIRDEIRKSREE